MVKESPAGEAQMAREQCPNCGKSTGERGHLCSPTVAAAEAYVCDHCGRTERDPRHVCFPKLAEVKFTCGNCGRVAVMENDLCKPRPIRGRKEG
jgi:predicted RNA-binding Zn-ribbon protein involved in translation (DUF1610 family)